MGILDAPALTKSAADKSYAGRGVAWSELPTPWFIGHRGGRFLGPEETMELYRICVSGGFAIEPDIRHLVDGTPIASHDATTGRAFTGVDTDLATMSPPQFMQRRVKASAIPGGPGAWDDSSSPALWSQIVAEFGNKQVLVPQVVFPADVTRVLDILDAARVNKQSVLVQIGRSDVIASACIARGYTSCWVADADVTGSIAHCVATGIPWIQGDFTTWTQANVDAARAAGLKVMLYTVNRRSDVARFTGVDSWFSDDPWYVSGQTQFERKTDPFLGGSWVPGLFGSESVDTAERGKFYTGGWWGFDASASIHTIGHFYLAPTDPSNYTLDFTLQIDAINASDTTRGAYIYLGQSDKYWNDQNAATTTNDGPNGYLLWLKADGTAQFYRKDYTGHTSTALGTTTIASAPTLGTPYSYRLTVTPTQLSLARLDAGAITTMTKTDSTFRALRYIHLGRVGAGLRYKSITVS